VVTIGIMKNAELGLNLSTKRKRKHEYLTQMGRVMPLSALVELNVPHAPEGNREQPPFHRSVRSAPQDDPAFRPTSVED